MAAKQKIQSNLIALSDWPQLQHCGWLPGRGGKRCWVRLGVASSLSVSVSSKSLSVALSPSLLDGVEGVEDGVALEVKFERVLRSVGGDELTVLDGVVLRAMGVRCARSFF
jgi:hypothetical protein